jgi:ankyrin repeat protein
VSRGANLEHQDNNGWTPLCIAAHDGYFGYDDDDGSFIEQDHLKTVQLLVDLGANLEHQDSNGRTPLGLAALEGHVDIVGLLVDLGADVQYQNSMGDTPLILAARNGHWKTVRLLLNQGAIVDHRDHAGRTALDYALVGNGGDHDLVHFLVRTAGQQGSVSSLQRLLYSD